LKLAKDGSAIYNDNNAASNGSIFRCNVSFLNPPFTRTLTTSAEYNHYRFIINNTNMYRGSQEIIGLDISGIVYEPISNDIYQVGNGSLNLIKNGANFLILPSFTSTLSGFSAAFWIRADTDASNACIFDFGDADASNAISTRFVGGIPRLFMNQNNQVYTYNIGSASLVDNSWNHIAWSIAPSTGIWSAYLNGVPTTSTGVSAYPTVISRVANYIGKYITDISGTNVSGMYVDDFRSFNSAIDSTQVANLYYGKTFVQGLEPINLTVLEITVNPSITLSFTGNPSVSSDEILTSPPTQKWTTTSTTITLTGLSNSTTYTLYVYGLNDFGDRSPPATLVVTMFDAPEYYYKFDAGDICGNTLIANYKTGTPIYDGVLTSPEILATTNIGMNSNTFSYTDPVNTYKSGTYDASASSFDAGGDPYLAFDDNSGSTTIWHCGYPSNPSTYLQNPYVQVGTTSVYRYRGGGNETVFWRTPVVGYSSISGEWLQIQMPYQLQITSYTLRGRSSHFPYIPVSFFIVGSNDGTTWYPLDIQTSATYTNLVYSRTGVVANGFYSYFRIVVQETLGIVVAIGSWEISGVPLNALPTINTSDYSVGTGSLQLVKTNQQSVLLPSFTSSSNGMSLSVWFKSTADASNSVIFDSSGSTTILSARLFKSRPTLYLQESGIEYSAAVPRTFTDNSWNHLLWNIDASGYWNAFVNGLQYNMSIRNVSATLIDPTSATITYSALPGATSYQIRTVPQTSRWTSAGLSQVITGLDATTTYRVLVSALIGTVNKSHPAETQIR
jgi:hypothetical protein